MSQIVKIRLPDGRTLVPSDWTSAEPLYSTVCVKGGAYTTLSAFSYGIGGDVPGSFGPRRSTLADTNLEGEGAQLPMNEEIIIYSIMVDVWHYGNYGTAGAGSDALPPPDAPFVSLNNMLRLQRDLILVTQIANIKEYTSHPLGWYPAGMGVAQVNAEARAADVDGVTWTNGYIAGTNGGIDVDSRRLLASPLYVNGGESLRIDVVAPTGQVDGLDVTTSSPQAATDGLQTLRIFLDGFRRRPVS